MKAAVVAASIELLPPSAWADGVAERIRSDTDGQKPLVVHVVVALCDNVHQGIVPVPRLLGNGQVRTAISTGVPASALGATSLVHKGGSGSPIPVGHSVASWSVPCSGRRAPERGHQRCSLRAAQRLI